MSYKIKPYSFRQAQKLGVKIKPSKLKRKKIDVFKKGEKVASIGEAGYKDYPTYLKLEKEGKVKKGTANKKQKLYYKRHKENIKVKNSPGYYAAKILW